MKEKRYQELTLPEKLIVGQIYDLYMEWISERLGHKYLKNSLFTDFKFAHHISISHVLHLMNMLIISICGVMKMN